ncbi:MAG TPA: DUF6152 family protein [Vicinamibacterales bacterium]|nr:DUF6152 family protein [Vicinamibacterales bacterium]
MTTRTLRVLTTVAGVAALAVIYATPAFTHHSFAMYDQNKVVTITGVVKQYVPQANHAEFHVYVLAPDRKGLEKGKDGKYVEYGVEMAGTAQLERQGITAQTYPAGTVISFRVNPLRDGTNFGARVGALAKCPVDPATKKPKLPEAGKHCDSVAGVTLTGGNTF